MRCRLTRLVTVKISASFQDNFRSRRPDYMGRAVWIHFMFSFGCFLGESCNAVLLWRSRKQNKMIKSSFQRTYNIFTCCWAAEETSGRDHPAAAERKSAAVNYDFSQVFHVWNVNRPFVMQRRSAAAVCFLFSINTFINSRRFSAGVKKTLQHFSVSCL